MDEADRKSDRNQFFRLHSNRNNRSTSPRPLAARLISRRRNGGVTPYDLLPIFRLT